MSNMQKSHQSSPAKAVIKSAKTEHKQKASLNPAQLMQAPETMRSEDVIGAQKQVGNQVVQRALDSHQHSDQAADQQGNLRKDLAQQIQQKRGSGSPLPGNIRKEVGQKMGRSFSDVRVHTDAKADQLNRSISARAFTIGSDIFFKEGVFEPGTSQGRETLMHELTHVAQQSGSQGGSAQLKLGAPDTAMEKEAEKVSKSKGAANPTARAAAGAGKAVQRQLHAGGTIQRLSTGFLDKFKKKKAPAPIPAPPIGPAPKLGTGKPSEPIKTKSLGSNPMEALANLKKTDVSERNEKEKDRAQDLHSSYKEESKKNNVNNSREALMAKLKDPSTSTEDAKLAQQKLNVLHKRGKMETLKAKLTRGKDGRSYAKQAMSARKKNLEASAKGGDDNAFKTMMAEKEERKKNSTGSKIKGALGGLLGKIGGAVGGAVKEQGKQLGSEYKDHFLGKKPEEKEGGKEDAHGGKEGGGKEGTGHEGGGEHGGKDVGGGGGGGGDVYKKLFDVMKENENLKAQISKSGGSKSEEGSTTGHDAPKKEGHDAPKKEGHDAPKKGEGVTSTGSEARFEENQKKYKPGLQPKPKEDKRWVPPETDEMVSKREKDKRDKEAEGAQTAFTQMKTQANAKDAPESDMYSNPKTAHDVMMKRANAKGNHDLMVKQANSKDAPESGIYSNPKTANDLMAKQANSKDAPESGIYSNPKMAHDLMMKKANAKDKRKLPTIPPKPRKPLSPKPKSSWPKPKNLPKPMTMPSLPKTPSPTLTDQVQTNKSNDPIEPDISTIPIQTGNSTNTKEEIKEEDKAPKEEVKEEEKVPTDDEKLI